MHLDETQFKIRSADLDLLIEGLATLLVERNLLARNTELHTVAGAGAVREGHVGQLAETKQQ